MIRLPLICAPVSNRRPPPIGWAAINWGAMLVEARPYLDRAPHLVLPPGLAIFLVVFGCNALGETLEDWLRPG